MSVSDEQLDRLTDKIIGCGIEVHRTLGPGLLESAYRECLGLELKHAQLRFESERRIRLQYKGTSIKTRLRIDMLVEDVVILELKAVECLHPVHLAQGMTYLKLTDTPAGLIMNFNVTALRSGIRRLRHPDRYGARRPIPASQKIQDRL